MSRSISELLPDVRIAAAGVPQFVALYTLTRAFGEFLDRSEAWREWLPVTPADEIVAGVASWSNHLGDNTKRWARIKRFDKVRWSPTGELIEFKTADQLQEIDPEWRTRTGSKPYYWTTDGEAAAIDEDHVSGYQVRFYPVTDLDDAYGVVPRAVVVTDTVGDFDLNDFDSQIPTVPDRIFYAFRNAIVSGALADLFLMPGKDWTDQKLASYHRSQFDAAIGRAKSRADADYGNASFNTGYGGI